MNTPLEQVAASPFVASWLGRARDGDLFDPDPARRAAAWAYWALRSMHSYTGVSERPYVALTLPGSFYDPRGDGPALRPHLELSSALFNQPDLLFPDRLAQAGNGLLFEWWLVPEVMALKRAVLGLPRGDVSALVDALSSHRPGLLSAYLKLHTQMEAIWPQVQADLVSEPEKVSDLIRLGLPEVDSFFPAAKGMSLQVMPEEKFATTAGKWLSRRVGVWAVTGKDKEHGAFSLGVVTPRLTRSSLFSDVLFKADKESTGALLVRSLLFKAILSLYSKTDQTVVLEAKTTSAGPYLKSVPARVGEKIPEASLAAAVLFVQKHTDPQDAWELLKEWADSPVDTGQPRALLTVTDTGFLAAHKAITRAVNRGESPDREDVNILLPLAWDHNSKVVRVTMVRSGDS